MPVKSKNKLDDVIEFSVAKWKKEWFVNHLRLSAITQVSIIVCERKTKPRLQDIIK